MSILLVHSLHMHVVNTIFLITVLVLLFYSLLLCIVYFVFECLRAPRKMGKCSLGLPSQNKDFIININETVF